MFDLKKYIGHAQRVTPPEPTDAQREAMRRSSNPAEYELRLRYGNEYVDAMRARMRWPRQPRMFKLDQRCEHCGSHDYVKWHDRTQCAYCRIPADAQPHRSGWHEADQMRRSNFPPPRFNAYGRPIY